MLVTLRKGTRRTERFPYTQLQDTRTRHTDTRISGELNRERLVHATTTACLWTPRERRQRGNLVLCWVTSLSEMKENRRARDPGRAHDTPPATSSCEAEHTSRRGLSTLPSEEAGTRGRGCPLFGSKGPPGLSVPPRKPPWGKVETHTVTEGRACPHAGQGFSRPGLLRVGGLGTPCQRFSELTCLLPSWEEQFPTLFPPIPGPYQNTAGRTTFRGDRWAAEPPNSGSICELATLWEKTR